MKIVKLKGGLGNQMFQYAYAKLLQTLTDEEVKLDYSAYEINNGDSVRKPRICQFSLTLDGCSKEELKKINVLSHVGVYSSIKYKAGIWIENKINKKYYLAPREYINPKKVLNYSYYDGYWQNVAYIEPIKKQLMEDFMPKEKISNATSRIIEEIKDKNAVFIGVRKGDYTSEKSHYGTFDSGYYISAMKYINERVENPIFYVFSNDVQWCKENMDWGTFQVIYREPDQQISDFEELILMTKFKHAIIINSTFHWWGAYLIQNKYKIVCCPEHWFFDDCHIDIYPSEWVKMPF